MLNPTTSPSDARTGRVDAFVLVRTQSADMPTSMHAIADAILTDLNSAASGSAADLATRAEVSAPCRSSRC
uniref:Uncharacterized protein n=1 Tax=Neobacillus citreus TaxID=2833578 RepID=A0A942T216_9BACI